MKTIARNAHWILVAVYTLAAAAAWVRMARAIEADEAEECLILCESDDELDPARCPALCGQE